MKKLSKSQARAQMGTIQNLAPSQHPQAPQEARQLILAHCDASPKPDMSQVSLVRASQKARPGLNLGPGFTSLGTPAGPLRLNFASLTSTKHILTKENIANSHLIIYITHNKFPHGPNGTSILHMFVVDYTWYRIVIMRPSPSCLNH